MAPPQLISTVIFTCFATTHTSASFVLRQIPHCTIPQTLPAGFL